MRRLGRGLTRLARSAVKARKLARAAHQKGTVSCACGSESDPMHLIRLYICWSSIVLQHTSHQLCGSTVRHPLLLQLSAGAGSGLTSCCLMAARCLKLRCFRHGWAWKAAGMLLHHEQLSTALLATAAKVKGAKLQHALPA